MSELEAKLGRRQDIIDGNAVPARVPAASGKSAIAQEFSRKELKQYEQMFKQFDTDRSGFIDMMELKLMMEKLGSPQTHLALKAMMKEVGANDEQMDFDNHFLMIFYKASRGELQAAGLATIAQSVNVYEEGVGSGKNFFEAKAREQEKGKKLEEEIKAEQAAKKAEAEAAKARRADFKSKAAAFA